MRLTLLAARPGSHRSRRAASRRSAQIQSATEQGSPAQARCSVLGASRNWPAMLRIGFSNAFFPLDGTPSTAEQGAEHRARSAWNLSLDAGCDLWGVGVKTRLVMNSFDEQIGLFRLPFLERLDG